jgi:hypothetical protein
VLPATLVLLILLTFNACANGGGLRVEGAEAPVSSAPTTPSLKIAPDTGGTPEARATPVTVSLAQVRLTLLADKQLDPFFRTLLIRCSVVERCLTRGPTVNVMRSSRPQIVVMVHTLENFIYGAVLVAIEPTGPRRVWSLKAEQPKINASPRGDLVVQSEIFTVDDKPCCPSVTRVEVYRWNGRQMIKVSSQDQKGV